MLKTKKSRQISAEFHVTENEQDILVKTTTLLIDGEGVTQSSETLINGELYAKHRSEMRKDERALADIRYATEDEIVAENEKNKGE